MKGLCNMAKKTEALTTSQFSEITGIPVSKVTKMVRLGNIKGAKQSGRWMIAKDQLQTKVVQALTASAPPAAIPKAAKPVKKNSGPASMPKPSTSTPSASVSTKTYSVSEFVEMTFLTDFGVMQWLKSGRLSGRQDEKGAWQVDASNLEQSHVKHLVR